MVKQSDIQITRLEKILTAFYAAIIGTAAGICLFLIYAFIANATHEGEHKGLLIISFSPFLLNMIILLSVLLAIPIAYAIYKERINIAKKLKEEVNQYEQQKKHIKEEILDVQIDKILSNILQYHYTGKLDNDQFHGFIEYFLQYHQELINTIIDKPEEKNIVILREKVAEQIIQQPLHKKTWLLDMKDFFSLNQKPIEKKPSKLKAISGGILATIIILMSVLGILQFAGPLLLGTLLNTIVWSAITGILLLSFSAGACLSYCSYENSKQTVKTNHLLELNHILENKKIELIKKFPHHYLIQENIRVQEKIHQLVDENISLKKELEKFQQQSNKQQENLTASSTALRQKSVFMHTSHSFTEEKSSPFNNKRPK